MYETPEEIEAEEEFFDHYLGEGEYATPTDPSFIAHGVYTVSNVYAYEVELSSDGSCARLRDPDGLVSDWAEIQYEESEEYEGEPIEMLAFIPLWGNIPLDRVMRVNR